MYSKTETMQTVVLNVLLNNEEVTIEEFKSALIHAGLVKQTDEPMINAIRALLISLNKFFKRHNIQLYMSSENAFKLAYTPTREAIKFASINLKEDMYDEEGNNVGWFFQHPVALEKERLELI
tara:strand:+ start:6265 stop:6633 length:369 start_codon:yes stop_codon:yes gene_type:complete